MLTHENRIVCGSQMRRYMAASEERAHRIIVLDGAHWLPVIIHDHKGLQPLVRHRILVVSLRTKGTAPHPTGDMQRSSAVARLWWHASVSSEQEHLQLVHGRGAWHPVLSLGRMEHSGQTCVWLHKTVMASHVE